MQELLASVLYCGVWWLLGYLPLSLLLCLPCWRLGQRRRHWTALDYAVVVVPYWCWAYFYLSALSRTKGLPNIVEGLMLALFTPLGPVIRMLVPEHTRAIQRGAAVTGIAVV
jgi:hypothetical protein